MMKFNHSKLFRNVAIISGIAGTAGLLTIPLLTQLASNHEFFGESAIAQTTGGTGQTLDTTDPAFQGPQGAQGTPGVPGPGDVQGTVDSPAGVQTIPGQPTLPGQPVPGTTTRQPGDIRSAQPIPGQPVLPGQLVPGQQTVTPGQQTGGVAPTSPTQEGTTQTPIIIQQGASQPNGGQGVLRQSGTATPSGTVTPGTTGTRQFPSGSLQGTQTGTQTVSPGVAQATPQFGVQPGGQQFGTPATGGVQSDPATQQPSATQQSLENPGTFQTTTTTTEYNQAVRGLW